MSRKLNYVGEVASVILVGVVAVITGMKLFGQGLVGSIATVWVANLLMLLAIYGALRVRRQRWNHLGLRPDLLDPRSFGRVVVLSIPVFVVAIIAFAIGAILMANFFGIPEPADMSKYDYLHGNLGLTILALASVYFVSSFAEEVIYRGFMMTRLLEAGEGKTASHVFAIMVSSLAFGLVHSDWGGCPGWCKQALWAWLSESPFWLCAVIFGSR